MDFCRPARQIVRMLLDPNSVQVPGLDISVGDVTEIIRRVAAAEILPRFRRLSDEQIGEKRPGEVVTEADTAAEAALASALTALVPNCLIVGEEGIEHAPEEMHRLNDDIPIFILDPVDGTQNFANGEDCFAVIVAFRQAGETRAGWIYAPIGDVTCWAVHGQGTYFDDGTSTRTHTDQSIAEMTGGLGQRARRVLDAKPDSTARPRLITRYRCVGREYMDLCAGKLDFVQFGQRLKPWDHAAGELLAREAGFTAKMIETERLYAPDEDGIAHGNLLIAPGERAWRDLKTMIT